MAYLAQPRRAKATGNSPAAASNHRKPFHSPPTYPLNSEPAVKWVSKEPNLKGPSNRGAFDTDNELGVAWDWQAREWVADRLPQSHADANHVPTTDPNQSAAATAGSAAAVRKCIQRARQGGWVSELEGISEKEVIVDSGTSRAKRVDNPVARNRRRGFYVADVQARRKPSQREMLLLKREKNTRRSPLDKAIVLTNGEPYLKPRGPSSLVDGADSIVKYMQSPNMRFTDQKLGFVSDGPHTHTNGNAKQQPELLFKAYVSANEIDHDDDSDDTASFHSERSACGMPWHWPGNNQRAKQDTQTDSAAGCFPVPKKGSRRNRSGHKFSSERSVSSFDSDSESIPLMTDPEQLHEYSEDFAASSVELSSETPRLANIDEFRFKRHGRLEDQGIGFYTNGQDLSNTRKQRDSGVRKHRSLSQKYRPKSFKDFMGQPMVVESLSNAILRDKIAPVYLFHGPRGTGKTTAAKIFTAAMNCLSIEELRPCGLCKECSSFNAGQNEDVKEIDAAGNNDVESMRLLLTSISQSPASSRYKVFIVDDCHTLNAEAWNALLKSLEEPPSFVVFILITTDLEQLPRTAMSRCQKFMFLRFKEADIVQRLRKLAIQERVEIDHEALLFIASRSDGSFRDAENMLDQLSLLGNRVSLAMVQEMVGLIPDDRLAKLLESALSADTVTTVNTIRELMESGVEPLALTSQLAVLITDILAGKKRVVGFVTMKVREEDHLRLKQALKILSESEKQLRSCRDRTTWLTAAFLQFAPNEPCLLPSSSRGTSVTPSPITLFDTSEKETLDLDFAGKGKSWGGDEKWGPYSPLQPDATSSPLQGPHRIENAMQRQLVNSNVHHFSGPFFDNNRVWACGHTGACAPGCKAGVSSGPKAKIQRESNTASPSTMDSLWRKVLQSSRSSVLKQLLQAEGRLVSLAVTEAFSLARLEFQHPEHKAMAERARSSIANAFQMALGCPVELEITLVGVSGEGNLCYKENSPFAQRDPKPQNGHINPPVDQEIGLSQRRRRMRSGSFRGSSGSLRNMASAIPSPLWQNPELRRPRHAFEIESRSSNRGITDVFSKDLDFLERRRSKDGAVAWGLKSSHLNVSDAFEGEKSKSLSKDDVQGRTGLVGAHCDIDGKDQAMSLQETGITNHEETSSDSEDSPHRDAPGALCWKGAQMKDKHHMRRRRRRRGRLLLRLVPCVRSGGRKQGQQEGGDQ